MLSYLFAAAAVVWIGMFVAVMVFVRRQSRLTKELAELRTLLTEWKPQR